MKKILLVILIIGLSAGVGYLLVLNNPKQASPSIVPSIAPESTTEITESVKISNLSFSYKTSPDGYVLINDQVSWSKNIISSVSLFNKLDHEWFSKPGFLGEGPPGVTISVFGNPEHLDAKTWADANASASNIKLIDNPPIVVTMGGVEGINYLVNGLYLFDTYVLAYHEEIYLLSGAYYEKNDKYYQNFLDVISTVVFK